jgi:hypothetical protein
MELMGDRKLGCYEGGGDDNSVLLKFLLAAEQSSPN